MIKMKILDYAPQQQNAVKWENIKISSTTPKDYKILRNEEFCTAMAVEEFWEEDMHTSKDCFGDFECFGKIGIFVHVRWNFLRGDRYICFRTMSQVARIKIFK